MADRISTRSASRRTTPQSPPKSTGSRSIPPQSPPQRTMRAIRSRSHDVSDSEASRTNSKSNRRRAPRQVSTEVVGDSSKSRNRTDTKVKPNSRSKALQGKSETTCPPVSSISFGSKAYMLLPSEFPTSAPTT